MPHREPGERALPTLAEVPHPRGPRGKRAARREHARRVRERGDARGMTFEDVMLDRRREVCLEQLALAAGWRRRGKLDMARWSLWYAAYYRLEGMTGLP